MNNVEKMIVHADDTRHHRISVQVDNRDASALSHISALLDRRDLSPLNDHILVFYGGSACTINHAHMRQHHLRSVYFDVLFDFFGKLRILTRERTSEAT